MKRSPRFLSLPPALVLLLLACRGPAAPEPLSIAGEWHGVNHNAHPPHHWRLDLDAQPKGRVTGTFGITSAAGVPVDGTIEGSQRGFHVVLHALGTRGASCIIQGVSAGDGLNTDVDCGWGVVVPVDFRRVR